MISIRVDSNGDVSATEFKKFQEYASARISELQDLVDELAPREQTSKEYFLESQKEVASLKLEIFELYKALSAMGSQILSKDERMANLEDSLRGARSVIGECIKEFEWVSVGVDVSTILIKSRGWLEKNPEGKI